MTIRGSVDSLSAEGASGWAFGSLGRPLVVQAVLDGLVIGETLAEQERPDLLAAGLGDGRCGFALAFHDAPLDVELLAFVSIRPRGGDVELPRTNLTGYGDFFRTIHARHPGAGRHRSVFGGLWTDRTDARRLLAGRVATGATPAVLHDPLRDFIGEGYVMLRGALAPEGLTTRDVAASARRPSGRALTAGDGPADAAFLEALADLLFREPTLRLLRGVLDDQPTVYRVEPLRDAAMRGFVQASTAERLPSPAECLLLVLGIAATPGQGLLLDIVRGSHELPEFTTHGRSRWLAEPLVDREPAGRELAREFGASVETLEIGPQDLVLLGPGTLHRLRAPPRGSTALRAWCLPQRISPMRRLTDGDANGAVIRHHSGAILAL